MDAENSTNDTANDDMFGEDPSAPGNDGDGGPEDAQTSPEPETYYQTEQHKLVRVWMMAKTPSSCLADAVSSATRTIIESSPMYEHFTEIQDVMEDGRVQGYIFSVVYMTADVEAELDEKFFWAGEGLGLVPGPMLQLLKGVDLPVRAMLQ